MFSRILVFFPLALALQAQTPAPQTYSFTEDPAFPIAGPAVVKITRDGAKEVVDQIMPAGFAGRQKEYHGHLLYDFQAHKLYTQVLSDPNSPCGLQDYAEPTAPAMFDPIGADLLKEVIGDGQLKQTGTETVNGIPTKVMQLTSTTGNGKVWLAETGGFLVKIASLEPTGKVTTLIEIKELSFSKPPASVFALPLNCTAVQTQAAPPQPSTNVTAITLQPIPKYNGACPAHITFTGTITVDGPGKVFYQFGAGAMEPGQIVTFKAAGTKTVSSAIVFQPKYGNTMGGSAILEAIGTDASGNHGALTKASNNSDFSITCNSGSGK